MEQKRYKEDEGNVHEPRAGVKRNVREREKCLYTSVEREKTTVVMKVTIGEYNSDSGRQD